MLSGYLYPTSSPVLATASNASTLHLSASSLSGRSSSPGLNAYASLSTTSVSTLRTSELSQLNRNHRTGLAQQKDAPLKPLHAAREDSINMVQRPASPTSLLWAHQLKKEHAHLLERMKALEAMSKDVVARMEEAEATTAAARETVTRVADMAARIAAIEEDDNDVRQWITKLDEERQAQARKGDDKLQSLSRKIGLLDAEMKRREVEEKEAKRRDDEILKRLVQLEVAREADKKAADKLVRKNDPVNKGLSRRLDAFESRRNEDDTKIAALLQKIKALESSNHELSTKTQQIQKKLESARTPRNHIPPRQRAVNSISTGTTQMETPLVTSPNVQVARSPLVSRQLRK